MLPTQIAMNFLSTCRECRRAGPGAFRRVAGSFKARASAELARQEIHLPSPNPAKQAPSIPRTPDFRGSTRSGSGPRFVHNVERGFRCSSKTAEPCGCRYVANPQKSARVERQLAEGLMVLQRHESHKPRPPATNLFLRTVSSTYLMN
jgi:predicted component of type VI protein secretion system